MAGAVASPLPPAPSGAHPGADAAAVGRYGEELAYRYLSAAAEAWGGGWTAVWENAAGESGRPYDIRLVSAAAAATDGAGAGGGGAGGGGVTLFVEVKASRASDRALFEMTAREMEFAEAAGDRYHVLRVSGAGSGAPTLSRLVNPALMWRAGLLRVCVVL